MPCKCLGLSVGTCSCGQKVIIPGGDRAARGDPQRRSLCASKKSKYTAPLTKIVENLYDTCAAYNIRHCPFQDVSQKGSVKSAICDLCVLACFLIANSVVLLTIVARALLHTSGAVMGIAKWAVGKVKFEPMTPTSSSIFDKQLNQPLN